MLVEIILGLKKSSTKGALGRCWVNLKIFSIRKKYSRTSTNGHLSTTATSLQRPPLYNSHFFWRTVHTFTFVSTSLQWPLYSVPKVAIVERLNCIHFLRALISIEKWKKLLPAMNFWGYRFTKILFNNPATALRVRKMVFLNGSDAGFSVNQNKI